MKKKKEKKAFPIIYNGKKYYEKDCHPSFLDVYQWDGSPYCYYIEGMNISPDGKLH